MPIAKLAKLIGTILEFGLSIKSSFEEFTAFYFQALISEIASNPPLVFKLNFKFKFVQPLLLTRIKLNCF